MEISPFIKRIIENELMIPENTSNINSGNFKPILSELNDKYSNDVMNSLIDTLKSAGISIKDKDMPDVLKFVNSIIGKTGVFIGLRDPETDKELEKYKDHKCIIVDSDDDLSFDPNNSEIRNFNRCYWDIEFPEFKSKNVVSGVPGAAIKLD